MNFLIECKIYSKNEKFEKCVKYTQKTSEKCVTRLLYYLLHRNDSKRTYRKITENATR